jgi:glycosyltransferase involved in cell wall biosynthesis
MNQPLFDKLPISIIILSQNEEKNIGDCLKSLVPFFDDIWVIDSYSEDRTMKIAQEYDAKILQHPFINYASQRNWALDNADLRYDWLMYIDADEQVTPQFCQELRQKITNPAPGIGGMSLQVDFIFLGRSLRFARPAVPMLRVFRRGQARWGTKGSREYGLVKGEIIPLKERIIHWNKKPLGEWITKQVKNAVMESTGTILRTFDNNSNNLTEKAAGFTYERSWRFWVRANIWDRLPKYWRSFPYFIYRYIVMGGFLDGKAGFAYCFLHALWWPLLIDMMIEERTHETNT